MKTPCRLLAALVATAPLAGGCVAYNEECSPMISEPEAVTGYLEDDVKVTKAFVRTGDNAIGQLVAQSYWAAFDDSPGAERPDVGLINSGAIRAEGICQPRELLAKGAVKRRALREVLPFDNRVVMVSLTHHQLKNVLEHAVASYSTIDPKGAFLQVHGIDFEVSCAQQGEGVGADGVRVSEGQRVTRLSLERRDGTRVEVPLAPPSDSERVWVAIDSYLLGGGDGFNDFKGLEAREAGSSTFSAAAAFFAKSSAAEAPWRAAPAPRIHLNGCL